MKTDDFATQTVSTYTTVDYRKPHSAQAGTGTGTGTRRLGSQKL